MSAKKNNFPGRISDGWLALAGGCSSGISPNLIQPNQYAFGINTASRGGWIRPRGGWVKITLDFQGNTDAEAAFKNSLFQEVGGYQNDQGSASLISMQGGRQFQVFIDNDREFLVNEITIPGDPNNPMLEMAWGIQAENFFIIQDGQSPPFIFDGASSYRANAAQNQVPVGNQMAYYQNRLWVANGREYVAGNQAFDPSGKGTKSLDYRNSMLYFTENQFLAGGGAFQVPIQSGDITGFKTIASPNTALGQGELIVTTLTKAFATSVPTDRLQWQNTTYPVQRVLQLSQGAYSQDSLVNVNEDIFYRTQGGISTLVFSVRNQGQWGNRVLSTEMDRILKGDSESFLPFCRGTRFDNRLLMTSSPGLSRGHGVYWRCLVPLDFFPISGMSGSSPPAWDGIWTGLKFLKLVTVQHFGVERCFAYVLNEADEIEVWELTKAEENDNDGEVRRIVWSTESRAMNFGDAFETKELMSSDLFFDEVSGQVDFVAQYRPDGYPCWIDWQTWDACAKTKECDWTGACVTLPNFKPQYRPQRQLYQPEDTFEPGTNKMFRTFFELQVRLQITGYCRMKQMRLNSIIKPDLPEMEQFNG